MVVACDLVKRILRTLLHLTLTATLIVLLPVIFTIFGLILLYRQIVCKLAKLSDPKLGKIVSAVSSLFAPQDVSINVAFHVAGKMDRVQLITRFTEIVQTKAPSGQLLYPELRQKLVKRFGYYFWKNVDNFKVDNHVSYLNPLDPDKPTTLEELHETMGRFGKMPMDRSRSPWEILVIKNFVDWRHPTVKSGMLIRYHHSMFDGYAVLAMISRMVDNGPLPLAGHEKLAQFQNKKEPIWRKYFATPLISIFVGTHELIGQMMRYDDNQLTQISKREFNGVMRFQEVEPMRVEELKKIKNHFQVTMSTLHTALVVGGLGKFVQKRNILLNTINMTFPLPSKTSQDKLRNNFTGGIIQIGMKHQNRTSLLQDIQKKSNDFQFAFAVGLPETSLLLLKMIGSLPSCLMPSIENVPSCTLLHSSFPGPVDPAVIFGFPIMAATVGGSINKSYPVGTLCFSYNGAYKIALLADTCILRSKEDAEEFAAAVYDEFNALARQVEENFV